MMKIKTILVSLFFLILGNTFLWAQQQKDDQDRFKIGVDVGCSLGVSGNINSAELRSYILDAYNASKFNAQIDAKNQTIPLTPQQISSIINMNKSYSAILVAYNDFSSGFLYTFNTNVGLALHFGSVAKWPLGTFLNWIDNGISLGFLGTVGYSYIPDVYYGTTAASNLLTLEPAGYLTLYGILQLRSGMFYRFFFGDAILSDSLLGWFPTFGVAIKILPIFAGLNLKLTYQMIMHTKNIGMSEHRVGFELGYNQSFTW